MSQRSTSNQCPDQMKLARYSMGIGDRFGREGEPLLAAFIQAAKQGVEITPVWNKSFREHSIIHSTPAETRAAADQAVKQSGWRAPYFVDADHINLKTVSHFIDSSDFFTLDVADSIGKRIADDERDAFVDRHRRFTGLLTIPQLETSFFITEEDLQSIAAKYLYAVKSAAEIYQLIRSQRHGREFICEISLDETEEAQTPEELFFILAAAADEGLPLQTIAPKFSGRFNKGVDYVGAVENFRREFEADVAVVQYAARCFSLSADLKLSIHSGSDKFSLYPVMRPILEKFTAGVHLKTAGTTWLEELIGLAMAGGEALEMVKEIYTAAYERYGELSKPYESVIDIHIKHLPTPKTIYSWDRERWVQALQHRPEHPFFNAHLRQLLHVSFKIAAEIGSRYTAALDQHRQVIAANVFENIYTRHMQPLFINNTP